MPAMISKSAPNCPRVSAPAPVMEPVSLSTGS
jgi:hypothetical protein